MKCLKFEALYQAGKWLTPAYAMVDEQGRLQSLLTEKPRNTEFEEVPGLALPGFQNAHSHAFQYAMAGLTEHRGPQQTADNFWSWREQMYRLAFKISPEQLTAVATQLYAEMLRNGYTSVVEFHYLHHQPDGSLYENLTEMGSALITAADTAGINITLAPVFYQMGGFNKSVEENQRRFICKNTDSYLKLLAASRNEVANSNFARLGMGIHSLRAVNVDSIKELEAHLDDRVPFHIHISEQKQEVEECLIHLKRRPVEWLLENLPLNQNFHLVHATHINPEEVSSLAKSGAHVVLCPSTEGNLGDGIFPLVDFSKQGGRWSIGSDSHIGLSPLEEIRWLDYGQRLTHQLRNPIAERPAEDSGKRYLDQCYASGRAAMGCDPKPFVVGEMFDAVVVDSQHPIFAGKPQERIISTLLFSGDSTALVGTITHGRWAVKSQQHLKHDKISDQFNKVMTQLMH